MGLMRSGMNLQNEALEGLVNAAHRESLNDEYNIKARSDQLQSKLSTAGSMAGLAVAGAVEAKKRGWFDGVGSVLNDIF